MFVMNTRCWSMFLVQKKIIQPLRAPCRGPPTTSFRSPGALRSHDLSAPSTTWFAKDLAWKPVGPCPQPMPGAGILKVVHPICSLDSQYTFKIDKSCAMPAWVYTGNSEMTSSQRSQLARNKNIYNYASRPCAESRKT